MPVIVVATSKHATEIADLHLTSIPGQLSKLSTPLVHLYYKNVCLSESILMKVLLDEDAVIGFYMTQISATFSHLKIFLKRPVALLIKLILSPKSLYFLMQAMKTPKNYLKRMPTHKLIYFAVHEKHRGKDLGKLLFMNLKESLAKMEIESFGLLVEDANESAMQFYKNQGGQLIDQFQHVNRMVYTLFFNTKDTAISQAVEQISSRSIH